MAARLLTKSGRYVFAHFSSGGAALRRAGIKIMSISLDGATAATHDGVRGVEGHFAATLATVERLRHHGITVQVNTVVMRQNVDELPGVARIVKESGAAIWEVFFLVQVGRGRALGELTPAQNEDVCHFLVDAARYGVIVRTVEAPFFRRVVVSRKDGPGGGGSRHVPGYRAAVRAALRRASGRARRADLADAGADERHARRERDRVRRA